MHIVLATDVSAPLSYRASNPWEPRMADTGRAAELLRTARSEQHERADQALTTKAIPARPGDAERLAGHAQVGALLREGFRYVGLKRQRTGLFGRFRSHLLVHPDGVAYVSVRAEKKVAPYYSRWFVVTTFDDGSVLQTSSLPRPVIPSSERFTARGGAGKVVADVAGHLEALRKALAADDRRILPARDIDDAIAHERISLRHAHTEEVARRCAEVWRQEVKLVMLAGGTAAVVLTSIAEVFARH